jgi:hypothetical protein
MPTKVTGDGVEVWLDGKTVINTAHLSLTAVNAEGMATSW